MKKTISMFLCVIMIMTQLSGSVSAIVTTPMLPEVNVEDSVNRNCSLTDLRTEETLQSFGYGVAEGYATVIVFSYGDTNTKSLLAEMDECEWIDNPDVRFVIIDGSDDDMTFATFRSMMGGPDILDHPAVEVYECSELLWRYTQLLYNEMTLIPPLTVIITKESGRSTIKYASRGAVGLTSITNSLSTIVSNINADDESKLVDITISGKRLYDEAYKVFELVNQERAREGLTALVFDARVTELAMRRAAECQVSYSHTRPNGTSCFTINDDGYYSEGYLRGENIAIGYQSAEAVMNGWMNSSGHRSNIMGSGHQSIGIGAYVSGSVITWCQLFASNHGEPTAEREPVATGEKIETLKESLDLHTASGSREVNLIAGESLTLAPIQGLNAAYGWGRYYIKPVIDVKSGGGYVWVDSNNLTVTGRSAGVAVLELRAYEESPVCVTVTVRVSSQVPKGDFDNNGTVNILDVEYLLGYMLYGASSYPVTQSADMNSDGTVNVTDVEFFLNELMFDR